MDGRAYRGTAVYRLRDPVRGASSSASTDDDAASGMGYVDGAARVRTAAATAMGWSGRLLLARMESGAVAGESWRRSGTASATGACARSTRLTATVPAGLNPDSAPPASSRGFLRG